MRQETQFWGEGQQRTALYLGKTQLPFARGSRALSLGVCGGGGGVPMASTLLATKWNGLVIIKVQTEL